MGIASCVCHQYDGILFTFVCVFTSFFFFFQAEDGIRDKLVTGVQTCALPISVAAPPRSLWRSGLEGAPGGGRTRDSQASGLCWGVHLRPHPHTATQGQPGTRSEERRVGKECRSRWSPYH